MKKLTLSWKIREYLQYKKSTRFGIRTLIFHQFHLCKVWIYIFYQAFLNFVWGKYVNQFWLPYKKWLSICRFNFRLHRLKLLHSFNSWTKFHLNLKNAITLILRKIQNPITFEHLLRFQTKIKESNNVSFIYSYEELFGSKFEFRGTWSDNALFLKNSNMFVGNFISI